VLATLGLIALGARPGEAIPPGPATLLGPTGVVEGMTLNFAWQGDPTATFYYLQLNDATASPRFTAWYPAAQACPGGSATCWVALTTGLGAGGATWWIRTWNADGFGPWRSGLSFSLRYVAGGWEQTLPAADRFQLVLGGVAVLDRETGLVWERTPHTNLVPWANAIDLCVPLKVGGRQGWRLPTIDELSSLADPSRVSPSLPPGHPFGSVPTDAHYWSATEAPVIAGSRYVYSFLLATPSLAQTGTSQHAWCVRGGQGRIG
jgi:hypothetical protein